MGAWAGPCRARRTAVTAGEEKQQGKTLAVGSGEEKEGWAWCLCLTRAPDAVCAWSRIKGKWGQHWGPGGIKKKNKTHWLQWLWMCRVRVSQISRKGITSYCSLYPRLPSCTPITWGLPLPSSEIPDVCRNQWSHALTCFNNVERKTTWGKGSKTELDQRKYMTSFISSQGSWIQLQKHVISFSHHGNKCEVRNFFD